MGTAIERMFFHTAPFEKSLVFVCCVVLLSMSYVFKAVLLSGSRILPVYLPGRGSGNPAFFPGYIAGKCNCACNDWANCFFIFYLFFRKFTGSLPGLSLCLLFYHFSVVFSCYRTKIKPFFLSIPANGSINFL